MSFFIRKANKVKHVKNRKKNVVEQKKKARVVDEVSSESEEEFVNDTRLSKKRAADSHSESEEETAQEKKVRLAKKYLETIEKEEKERADNEDYDDSAIGRRLKDEVLEKSGHLFKKVADNYLKSDLEDSRCFKNGHKLSVTCVCVSSNLKYLYSASKDCSVIQWCFQTCKKLKVISGVKKGNVDVVGHKSCVNCIAISSDDKFLATGCQSNTIIIWNAATMEFIKSFSGHRGAITGLAFRKGFHSLYSCSADKSVKVWNLDEMSYIETLFGHEAPITAIDSLTRERAITAGGSDCTIRLWKIVEESQLVFHGHTQSIDCVKLIDEQHFITGGQDGSIALWDISKKRPVSKIVNAHGSSQSVSNWITSIASFVNTDLFVSGSSDGNIHFWKCCDFKKIESLFSISVNGFINNMQLTQDGKFLVVAVGQEHRLGRWWNIKNTKNCVYAFPLRSTNSVNELE